MTADDLILYIENTEELSPWGSLKRYPRGGPAHLKFFLHWCDTRGSLQPHVVRGLVRLGAMRWTTEFGTPVPADVFKQVAEELAIRWTTKLEVEPEWWEHYGQAVH